MFLDELKSPNDDLDKEKYKTMGLGSGNKNMQIPRRVWSIRYKGDNSRTQIQLSKTKDHITPGVW